MIPLESWASSLSNTGSPSPTGRRYFDIIRWRIADKVKKGKVYGARLKAVNENMDHKYVEERFWDDKMYLFPVPQEAVDNNPNLLPQNKGWE